VGGSDGEFLDIEYAKGDKLYVPVAQLHLVSRYSGADAGTRAAALARRRAMGEGEEEGRREGARRRRRTARDPGQRQARAGLALPVDRAMYEQFAARPSRSRKPPTSIAAIEAVIADLAVRRPMDRVVCGDVGFGKTEVAVRAAFVAAIAASRSAVLVPHHAARRAALPQLPRPLRRLADQVEVLSRFKSAKEIKAELAASWPTARSTSSSAPTACCRRT
jgi:transcription-repair coupling factor (superfamily II helicase)